MDIFFSILGVSSDYLKAALVTGLFQFFGAIIAAWVALELFIRAKLQQSKRDQQLRHHEQQQAQKERLTRAHDLATAIRAEIAVNYFIEQGLRQQLALVLANKTHSFTLFSNPDNFIFDTIKSDTLILPRPIIEAVVSHYKTEELLSNVLDQTAKSDVANSRQHTILLSELAKRLEQTARTAFKELTAFIGDNPGNDGFITAPELGITANLATANPNREDVTGQ